MGEYVTIKSYRVERQKEIIGGLQKALEEIGRLIEKQAGKNVSKTGNEHPQIKTGNLLGSITHQIGDGEVVIGTNVKYGEYLEHGTSRMPPYPWLYPAVELRKPEIIEILKSSGARDVSII